MRPARGWKLPDIYPGQKRFAFSIVDDTDNATVENVKPVYDLLTSLGFRVTKTVWVYPSRDRFSGQCLRDPPYLDFVRQLSRDGHEIALHNVGSGAFSRQEIRDGIELFNELLGFYPQLHVNHVSNPDNLYWRPTVRFRRPVSWLYWMVQIFMRCVHGRPLKVTAGESPDSIHYWGDVCQQHIRYVRNLTFSGIDTLAADPRMPYHDPRKPLVRNWFSSADGHTVDHFRSLLSDANIDVLESQSGTSIVYTHFTDGFVQNGKVDPGFAEGMTRLAKRPGWYVPTSEVLDYLGSSGPPGFHDVSNGYLRRLEIRWLAERMMNYLRYRR